MIAKQITTLVQKLDPIRQQAILDYLRLLLQEQELETSPKFESPGPLERMANSKGWVEVKTINGHQYAYRRWRQGKTLKSEYIGKVGA